MMKKVVNILITCVTVMLCFTVESSAAVPASKNDEIVYITQNYDDSTTDEFAYSCKFLYSRKVNDNGNYVFQLKKEAMADAQIPNLDNVDRFTIEFDIQPKYASADFRVCFTLDSTKYTVIRINPGTFVPLFEKKRTDFSQGSNIYNGMWMSSATVANESTLASDEWFHFKVDVDKTKLGPASETKSVLDAVCIRYKKKTDANYKILEGSMSESPWSPGWVPMDGYKYCTKTSCNVSLLSRAETGQQYSVWLFNEQADTINKVGSDAHYRLDNVSVYGGLYISKGVIHFEDYEGENPTPMFGELSKLVTDENGNTYMEVNAPSRVTSGASRYIESDRIVKESLPEGFAFTIDLCSMDENNADFIIEYFSDHKTATNAENVPIAEVHGGYAVSRYNWNVGDWYRYKLVKFPDKEKPVATLINLSRDEIVFENSEVNKEGNVSSETWYNRFYFLGNLWDDSRVFHFGVDNFTLTELGAVSIEELTQIDDTVEAKLVLDATDTSAKKATGFEVSTILGLYNDGKLVAITSETASIDDLDGVEKKLTASGNYDKAVLFFWKDTKNMQPVIEMMDITDLILKTTGNNANGYTKGFLKEWYSLDGWSVDSQADVDCDFDKGIIHMTTDTDTQPVQRYSIKRTFTAPENYDVEFKLKIPYAPEGRMTVGTWISISPVSSVAPWIRIEPHRVVFLNNSNDGSNVDYTGPSYAIIYENDDQWHTWKAEVRKDVMTWYVDGKELVSFDIEPAIGQSAREIRIWHDQKDDHIAEVLCDWIRYTPYFDEELKLILPTEDGKIQENTPFELKATSDYEVSKVDYYINGVCVGSGDGSDHSLAIDGLKAGKYRLKAVAQKFESAEFELAVEPKFSASLSFDKEQLLQGDTANIVVNTSGSATKVEFYANGNLFAEDIEAPFSTEFTGNTVGTHTVYARVYHSKGAYYNTPSKRISVDYQAGNELSIGREYTIDYSYSGNAGELLLNDGYFRLSLNHDTEGLSYEDIDGLKTYKGLANGNYKVNVTAGYAEVYWNNHFAFSFLMPYSQTAQELEYSGLLEFELKGSGVKAELFGTSWQGQERFEVGNIADTRYYSIEFDKTDSSAEEVEFYDGVFENKLFFRNDGIYVNRALNAVTEKSELKLCDQVTPGYYRLTVNYGMAVLFCNNKAVGQYRCAVSPGKTRLIRTMTNPSASTFIALKDTDDIYYHTDTFEAVTEYSYDEYWSLHNENYSEGTVISASAKLVEENQNHYMNISGTGVYLLNVNEKNPTLKWKGRADRAEGRVYLMLRRSFADRNTKIGYDFGSSQWFFERVEADGSIAEQYTQTGAFEASVWHDFELISDDFRLELICDGKTVLAVDIQRSNLTVFYGRLGFGTENSSYSFDNVEYIGGNRVTAGLSYTSGGYFGQEVTNTAADFYKDTDGNIVATGFINTLVSKDDGKTWGDMVLKTDADTKGRIFEEQMVTMPNGNIVRINPSYFNDNAMFTANVSTDGGKSWSANYFVCQGIGKLGCVSRLTCTKSGRLFLCLQVGSTEEYSENTYIVYSDDGKTWRQSETVFHMEKTGSFMAEETVIDTPRSGEVWFLARSDSGFVNYYKSYDNGQTFELTPNHLGLIATSTTYKIERDWTEPETYYAIFMYDTETSDQAWIQQPRNRVALAVSYDGMENWEYITDLMAANNWPGWFTSDSVIRLIDDTIYWRTSNAGFPKAGTNFGAQQLSKIKTLKRMPQMHYRHLVGYDFAKHTAPDQCVVSKGDEESYVFGRYFSLNVNDGRIDADAAEVLFGVTAELTDDGIILRLGKSQATFREGAKGCNVDGMSMPRNEVVLLDGMLDLETLCEVYGKAFLESENAYYVLDKTEIVDCYQKALADFV